MAIFAPNYMDTFKYCKTFLFKKPFCRAKRLNFLKFLKHNVKHSISFSSRQNEKKSKILLLDRSKCYGLAEEFYKHQIRP